MYTERIDAPPMPPSHSILFFCFENVEERLRDWRREIWTETIHDQVFLYLFHFSERIRPDPFGLDYKTKTTVDHKDVEWKEQEIARGSPRKLPDPRAL